MLSELTGGGGGIRTKGPRHTSTLFQQRKLNLMIAVHVTPHCLEEWDTHMQNV